MSTSSDTARVSRRYAQALFELVQEGSKLRKDLAVVAEVASTDEVAKLLQAPECPAVVKQNVLLKAAGGKVLPEVERLVAILAERGKSELIPEIQSLLEDMVRRAESEVDAEVIVATEMEATLQDKLADALAASTGRKVRLNFSVDKGILGGMIVRLGDRKIDYSLRTRLDGLRRTLSA